MQTQVDLTFFSPEKSLQAQLSLARDSKASTSNWSPESSTLTFSLPPSVSLYPATSLTFKMVHLEVNYERRAMIGVSSTAGTTESETWSDILIPSLDTHRSFQEPAADFLGPTATCGFISGNPGEEVCARQTRLPPPVLYSTPPQDKPVFSIIMSSF